MNDRCLDTKYKLGPPPKHGPIKIRNAKNQNQKKPKSLGKNKTGYLKGKKSRLPSLKLYARGQSREEKSPYTWNSRRKGDVEARKGPEIPPLAGASVTII